MKHEVNLQKLEANIPNQQNRNVLARRKPHHNHSRHWMLMPSNSEKCSCLTIYSGN